MKKSVVAGLIALALIVLISPGLIGKFAERSVDNQLDMAARENREFEVTASNFERQWFSSEGTHRITIADTPAGAVLREQYGLAPGDESPALIIETHLDHGLVPVGSVQRENTSLMPGLGSAESRLAFETAGGERIAIPGVVITHVGLAGGIDSRYLLEAGASDSVQWGDADMRVRTDARHRRIEADGRLDSIDAQLGPMNTYRLAGLALHADLEQTAFGFRTGDSFLRFDNASLDNGEGPLQLGPLEARTRMQLDGDRALLAFMLEFTTAAAGDEASVRLRGQASELHAASLGRLSSALRNARRAVGPDALLQLIDADLQALLASGLQLDIDTLEISRPEGTASASIVIEIAGSDPDAFTWASLLLDTEARADIKLPTSLFETLVQTNPDLQMVAGMGFLKRNGDVYEMQAEYRKGLLLVNGAPVPVPLPTQ